MTSAYIDKQTRNTNVRVAVIAATLCKRKFLTSVTTKMLQPKCTFKNYSNNIQKYTVNINDGIYIDNLITFLIHVRINT